MFCVAEVNHESSTKKKKNTTHKIILVFFMFDDVFDVFVEEQLLGIRRNVHIVNDLTLFGVEIFYSGVSRLKLNLFDKYYHCLK